MLREYRMMWLIRRFEERVEDLFRRGWILGTAHAAIGQEAVAVGAMGALRRGDYVTSTHRGHGHMLARGGDPRRMMAELFGKATGYSRGRGGSQLMADFRGGFLGANGITGGSLPIATGVALSTKLRKTGRIVACMFGDGAANQGVFHESLNMASIWCLPVVYVCENNGYAMSMPVSKAMAVERVSARAAAYGMQGATVDGNDLPAVRRAMREACARARAGGGPTLLECGTYRLSGHSRGDPRVYRSREEEDAAWRRDPILRFRAFLRERSVLSPDEDRRARSWARATVSEAVRFARRSPAPDPRGLTEGLFA